MTSPDQGVRIKRMESDLTTVSCSYHAYTLEIFFFSNVTPGQIYVILLYLTLIYKDYF